MGPLANVKIIIIFTKLNGYGGRTEEKKQYTRSYIAKDSRKKEIEWKIERRDTGRAHTHTTSICNSMLTIPRRKGKWKRRSEMKDGNKTLSGEQNAIVNCLFIEEQ